MKYYPKLNQYKASNVTYDATTEQAWSYEWYCLAERINGTMIVNSYSYSSTTIRHYYKIKKLLDNLSIKYLEIEAPRGLQDLNASKLLYIGKVNQIKERLANTRIRQTTRKDLITKLGETEQNISFVDSLRGVI